MGCVIGGDADLDTIPNHNLDSVFLHSSGKHAPYGDVVVTLNFHCAATQNLGNFAL
jgi:hypothetical protein